MCDVRRPLPLAPPVANCIKTIQPVRGVSPLKLLENCENKYRSTEHGCIGFRWLYMWDPEYCDSELGAVEASGESRYELCPSTDTAETQSQVVGWYTCDQCLAVAQDAMDKTLCWDYPYARPHPDLRCLAEFLCVSVLSSQLGTSF